MDVVRLHDLRQSSVLNMDLEDGRFISSYTSSFTIDVLSVLLQWFVLLLSMFTAPLVERNICVETNEQVQRTLEVMDGSIL